MKRLPPEHTTAYAVTLTPRAAAQLQGLGASGTAAVTARLQRLAQQAAATGAEPAVHQGMVVGRLFRALYEVDHEAMTLTVLDVSERE